MDDLKRCKVRSSHIWNNCSSEKIDWQPNASVLDDSPHARHDRHRNSADKSSDDSRAIWMYFCREKGSFHLFSFASDCIIWSRLCQKFCRNFLETFIRKNVFKPDNHSKNHNDYSDCQDPVISDHARAKKCSAECGDDWSRSRFRNRAAVWSFNPTATRICALMICFVLVHGCV